VDDAARIVAGPFHSGQACCRSHDHALPVLRSLIAQVNVPTPRFAPGHGRSQSALTAPCRNAAPVTGTRRATPAMAPCLCPNQHRQLTAGDHRTLHRKDLKDTRLHAGPELTRNPQT